MKSILASMEALIKHFPEQLSLAAIRNENINQISLDTISQVVICGVGGSGIGGTIIQNLTSDSAKKLVFCNKNYALPAFVDAQSLVIISSYSGNTEESIACLEAALQLNCKIICISSGGRIAQLAEQHQLANINLPADMPPRTTLGYGLVALLHILTSLKIVPDALFEQLTKGKDFLLAEQQEICTTAQTIAQQLKNDYIPVMYASSLYAGVAERWRQQINENSKTLAWHHVIPEMNHNEIMGWSRDYSHRVAAFFFHTEDELTKVKARIKFTSELVQKHTDLVQIINAKGSNKVERTLYLIHLGDWVSYYLALAKNVDPVEVGTINALKQSLEQY